MNFDTLNDQLGIFLHHCRDRVSLVRGMGGDVGDASLDVEVLGRILVIAGFAPTVTTSAEFRAVVRLQSDARRLFSLTAARAKDDSMREALAGAFQSAVRSVCRVPTFTVEVKPAKPPTGKRTGWSPRVIQGGRDG